MSEEPIQIRLGDPSKILCIGKFKAGYDVNLKDIDETWYIQKKPEEKEEEPDPKLQRANKRRRYYKSQPNPADNTWFMHSESGRYFKETVEATETPYFVLLPRNGYFEAIPVHEQHSFNPIPKPRFNETDEQRRNLKKVADKRRKLQDKMSERFVGATSNLSNFTGERETQSILESDLQKLVDEELDYDHEASDDEGIVASKISKPKKLTDDGKDLAKVNEADEEEEDVTDSKPSLLGKRLLVDTNFGIPAGKIAKVGTEMKLDNLVAFLRQGRKTFKEIRKHFRKSGTKEELKTFFVEAMSECAVQDVKSKTFTLKPNYQ